MIPRHIVLFYIQNDVQYIDTYTRHFFFNSKIETIDIYTVNTAETNDLNVHRLRFKHSKCVLLDIVLFIQHQ